MRALVPPERQKQALFSVMLVPSVVFWSSSLLKEAIALMGIGLAVLGLALCAERSGSEKTAAELLSQARKDDPGIDAWVDAERSR